MRLATLYTEHGFRIVAVDSDLETGTYWDLAQADESMPRSLKALLTSEDGLSNANSALQKCKSEKLVITDGKLSAPIASPGKIICIGLNYRDHAIETGARIPTEPVCFGKFGNTIIGPEDEIRIPSVSEKVDYEAELVIVIGKTGKNIAKESAMDHIAGYMNGHDVSARDWQKGRPGGQWMLGKTPDTFAPIGPWLVTKDEVPNVGELNVQLRLNGDVMQNGSTSEFIFDVEELIHHVSKIMTLEPGDIIFTGTPPGVGDARTPPVYMKPGDNVEVEIEHLGVLKNSVVAE